MKLAKIVHYRCSEQTDATTYVWVADDMTADEFNAVVQVAKTAYLDALLAYKKDPNAPPYVGYTPDYDRMDPALTIAEAKALHKVRFDARKAWEARRAAIDKPFAEFLIATAPVRIRYFWNVPAIIETVVQWGHQHGEQIDYSGTKPLGPDFNEQVEKDGD